MQVDFGPNVETDLCSLEIEELGEALSLEDAWRMLPEHGQGVVSLADQVTRYDPDQRTGLLLAADVVEGLSTVIIRQVRGGWKGWRWTEGTGETHRYFEREYLSSEPGKTPPNLIYRHYWKPVPDQDGISVWTPIGARFYGYQEVPCNR